MKQPQGLTKAPVSTHEQKGTCVAGGFSHAKLEDIFMKTVQATFLLMVCFLGCTSTYRLRPAHEEDYVSLNNRAAQKHAMVTFVGGRKIRVDDLRMTADSTYWNYSNRIATAQIKEVRFISRGQGALPGMLIGSPVGAVIGFTVGQDCQGGEFLCFPRDELAVIGAISGAFWGAIVGAIIGQKDIYLIEHEAATGTH